MAQPLLTPEMVREVRALLRRIDENTGVTSMCECGAYGGWCSSCADTNAPDAAIEDAFRLIRRTLPIREAGERLASAAAALLTNEPLNVGDDDGKLHAAREHRLRQSLADAWVAWNKILPSR